MEAGDGRAPSRAGVAAPCLTILAIRPYWWSAGVTIPSATGWETRAGTIRAPLEIWDGLIVGTLAGIRHQVVRLLHLNLPLKLNH